MAVESIDTHWHVLPISYVDAIRRDEVGGTSHIEKTADGVERLMLHPPEGVTVEQGTGVVPAMYDDALMLADMDRMRLDAAAISVNPPLFQYWAEPEAGALVARLLNDGMAELMRAHPDRIFGLATLPMQDVTRAAAELERAVTQLGFRGAGICTHVNGKLLDDPGLEPVWAAAERLEVPFFLHPQNFGDISRYDDYHLWNLFGFPMETALAVARMIFGGVFERHPDLKIIMAHGGGYFPYQVGRLDHGYSVRNEAQRFISRKPSEYLGNVYSDSLTHSGQSLRFLTERLGSDHVVLGSDHPFDMCNWEVVDAVRHLDLGARREKAVLGRNLARLLKLA